jgi:inosose dehydratase
MKTSRRNFLKITGAGTLSTGLRSFAGASPESGEKDPKGEKDLKKAPFRLGIASYSLRNFKVDYVVDAAERLRVSAISLKSMHLPLDAGREQIETTVKMFNDKGIEVYGGGVIYMKDRDEVDRAFEYARMAGMKIIIGVPDRELLPYAGEKAEETGIRLAIHNHGPGDKNYPGPGSVYELIRDMGPGVGICVDIGHTARIGLNPAVEIEKYFPRVLDIHIKDVTRAKPGGENCIIGFGVIDFPEMIKTLLRLEYPHTLSLEYEAEADDPVPGMARCFGYVQGTAAALGFTLD